MRRATKYSRWLNVFNQFLGYIVAFSGVLSTIILLCSEILILINIIRDNIGIALMYVLISLASVLMNRMIFK